MSVIAKRIGWSGLWGYMGLAVPAWAGATPAIPFKQDAAPAVSGLGGGVAMLLVSVLAIGAVYFLRKRLNLHGATLGAPRLLRVLESQRLGPRAMLSVVEFSGGHYLIAQSEHGITCLATSLGKPLATSAVSSEAT